MHIFELNDKIYLDSICLMRNTIAFHDIEKGIAIMTASAL